MHDSRKGEGFKPLLCDKTGGKMHDCGIYGLGDITTKRSVSPWQMDKRTGTKNFSVQGQSPFKSHRPYSTENGRLNKALNHFKKLMCEHLLKTWNLIYRSTVCLTNLQFIMRLQFQEIHRGKNYERRSYFLIFFASL